MSQPWYVSAYDERYYQTYKDEFSAEQTEAEVEGIIRLLDLSSGSRILDVCCGFGRHSIALAKRGYQVTGLDLSDNLLHHARAAAQEAGVEVTWISADMRDIPVPESPYNAVINVFSSFGFFGNDREESNVVQAMTKTLAPRGKVLIETVNREILLRHWTSLRWREMPEDVIVCDNLRFDVLTGILYSEEIMIRADGTRTRDTHQLRLWAYTELKQLLETAGFAEITAFGGLDGSTYTRNSHRMAAIGCKA